MGVRGRGTWGEISGVRGLAGGHPPATPRQRHLVAGMAATIGLLLALTACTNEEKASAPTPTPPSAAQRLAAAKAQTDAAPSLHLNVKSSGVPEGANGVIGVDGTGTSAPAFKGTLDARIAGLQAKVDVVALDGTLYLKLPFTTGFAATDPAKYNAPNPADLFAKDRGITSLLPATANPAFGEKMRAGSEVLQTITGTLPGAAIVDLLRVGDRNGTFDVVYGITDPGDQLRTATLTGPFFTGATSTYTVTLDRYGEKVDIAKP